MPKRPVATHHTPADQFQRNRSEGAGVRARFRSVTCKRDRACNGVDGRHALDELPRREARVVCQHDLANARRPGAIAQRFNHQAVTRPQRGRHGTAVHLDHIEKGAPADEQDRGQPEQDSTGQEKRTRHLRTAGR